MSEISPVTGVHRQREAEWLPLMNWELPGSGSRKHHSRNLETAHHERGPWANQEITFRTRRQKTFLWFGCGELKTRLRLRSPAEDPPIRDPQDPNCRR